MPKKNKAAVALGRRGGKRRAKSKGWEKIPMQERREHARRAAQARWNKYREASHD